MKKLFTKGFYLIGVVILFLGAALPASAQYTINTLGTNVHATAVASDASGNVYVIEDPTDADAGEILKYTNGTGAPATIYTSNAALADDNGTTDDYPFGIVVDSHGNLYVSTSSDFGNGFYGNILKFTLNPGSGAYTESTFITGNANVGEFGSMAIDANDNLYVVQYDVNGNGGASTNGIPGAFEVARYASGSTVFTTLYSKLELAEFASNDQYSGISGICLDPIGNVYVADSFDIANPAADGGHVYKLTKSTGFSSAVFTTGQRTTALASDASGNIYASNGSSSNNAYSIVEYAGGLTASLTTIYAGLSTDGNWYPTDLAAINSTDIFAIDGGEITGTDNIGNFLQLIGPATTQAANVTFSSTTGTATTASWTNGNGTSRAVFINKTSIGSPSPVNSTTYTANTNFGSGSQIGASGWYCVYNGTGTSVNITGLTVATTYRVMVVEYNGSIGAQNYLTSTAVNNPNNVTTLPPPTTINAITANSTYSNATTETFTATFGTAVLGLTTNNFSLTTTGAVSGASVSSVSGTGPSYTVTINTGTGDGTIGLNLANATNLSPAISTTLPFTGGTSTIDKTAPTVSIGNPSVGVTNSTGTINYTVTYTDANLNPSSINLTTLQVLNNLQTTGNVSVNSVNVGSPSGNTVLVSLNDITGDGTIGFTVPAGTASDLAGNPAAASSSSATSIVDNTNPTITVSAPSVNTVNPGGSVTYTVTYADANFSTATLVAGNITLNTTGTANGTIGVSGSGTNYTVTISGVTGTGSLGISVAAGTASDLAGNLAPAAGPSATFTVISSDASLTSIQVSPVSRLVQTSSTPGNINYSTSVAPSVTSVILTPTANALTSIIKVNGAIVVSGSPSQAIALNTTGPTTVTVLVTAQDGSTTATYSVTVNKTGSSNAGLSLLQISPASRLILAAPTPESINYTASVAGSVTSVTVTPTATDPNATIMVNGTPVISGSPSSAIALNTTGSTLINVLVTAQDGSTTLTYSVTVNKTGSSNAALSLLQLTPASPLTFSSATAGNINYIASVANSVASVTVTPTSTDPNATLMVNGTTVLSGSPSQAIALNVGNTAISTLVTAQDGVTTETYTITVTRAPSGLGFGNNQNLTLSDVENPADSLQNDGIVVHQGVSPNGDGINDFLAIDGITAYPDNKLTIIDRNGVMVFETKGYDNSSRIFDGHSSKNGAMQVPGTYFYSLDYTANGQDHHKTGFIILKY